jgi:hypothetical protein
MRVIINRTETFGTLGAQIVKNSELFSIVAKAIKEGKAELLIDTEETLMYKISQ